MSYEIHRQDISTPLYSAYFLENLLLIFQIQINIRMIGSNVRDSIPDSLYHNCNCQEKAKSS